MRNWNYFQTVFFCRSRQTRNLVTFFVFHICRNVTILIWKSSTFFNYVRYLKTVHPVFILIKNRIIRDNYCKNFVYAPFVDYGSRKHVLDQFFYAEIKHYDNNKYNISSTNYFRHCLSLWIKSLFSTTFTFFFVKKAITLSFHLFSNFNFVFNILYVVIQLPALFRKC